MVAIGTVRNVSDQRVNLRESSCMQEGLVAVTYFPNALLEPKKQREVLVMMHRNKTTRVNHNMQKRISLLRRYDGF